MKKKLFLVVLCFALLASCGKAMVEPSVEGEQPVTPGGEPTYAGSDGEGVDEFFTEAAPEPVLCRIVDGAEEGSLLLADAVEDSIYQGGGVYRVGVNENTLVYLDGEVADASVLKDGMLVEVFYNGYIMESFPAQFGGFRYLAAYSYGSEMDPGGNYYDLCGFYLKVLDDLWNIDPALNSDITVAGLDLSNAPGNLTRGQKAALAWRFGELHDVWIVEGTLEEIKENGYLTPYEEGSEIYWWEDGCMFVIEANEWEEGETYSLPVLKFNAHKWRSPLGAYGFSDCSAVWPQMGTWTEYNIGAQFIS